MKKLIVLLLVLCYSVIFAQNHYWGQQYGGQATLMGGTGVVGISDNSVLYYNPGAIGFIGSYPCTVNKPYCPGIIIKHAVVAYAHYSCTAH